MTFTGGAESGKRAPPNTLLMGTRTLVKADLGTKRACPSCGARFYDLSKRPIECPKCGFSFEPEALYKQRRGRQPEPAQSQVVRLFMLSSYAHKKSAPGLCSQRWRFCRGRYLRFCGKAPILAVCALP